jgi:hypothetical protein
VKDTIALRGILFFLEQATSYVKMSRLPQKAKLGIALMVYSLILFLPSVASAHSSPPSSFYFQSSSIPRATQPQTTTESNITIDNTIAFITPQIRVNYSASWNALPGIPTSPYVDSIITFTLLPENRSNSNNTNNNSNNSEDSVAVLNIAKHALFHESVLLEEYVGTQLYFLRNTIPGFKLLQFNGTTLDGRPAYQAVYTGLEGTDTTKTMKNWVSSGDYRYIVTYSAKEESFSTHLESVRDVTDSLRIAGAQANQDLMLIKQVLGHIPPSSQEKVLVFSNGLVLSSVFDGNLAQFMEGSTATPPSYFTKLPAYPAMDGGSNISAYYYVSPSYLSPKSDNPETNEPYRLLVVVFKNNNNSNNLIAEPPPSPIDYRVRINGTVNFAESGSTSTGSDIKILKGSSFAEALNSPQQFGVEIDVENLSRSPGRPSS